MAKARHETVFEKDGSVFVFEMATSEKFTQGKPRLSQLNNGQGAFEMHGDLVPELEGADSKSKKGGTVDEKIGLAA